MNLFYTDFDRRFLSESQRQGTIPRRAMTDAQVVREMAEVWFDSGGDADGLTDEHITQLRAEIARMDGAR